MSYPPGRPGQHSVNGDPILDGAACRDHPLLEPDSWFALWPSQLREAAILTCLSCPVLAECRSWSVMEDRLTAGIFAAMTERERRAERQRRKQAAALAERSARTPSRNPGALARALEQLRTDPARSDRLIAAAAGCNPATVRRARRLDPALAPPRDQRAARPKPARSSDVRDMIQAGATSREIMWTTGCSFQAVWKMRRRLRAAVWPAGAIPAGDQIPMSAFDPGCHRASATPRRHQPRQDAGCSTQVAALSSSSAAIVASRPPGEDHRRHEHQSGI